MKLCKRLVVSSLWLCGTTFLAASPEALAVDRGGVSSKVLYQAVDQLTDYFRGDLAEVAKHTKKTAIINYTQSEELPTSLQHYVIKRLENLATTNERSPVAIVQCIECTALLAVAEGDEIFIRKGIADDAQLQDVMKKLDIRKYTDVNVTYTGDQLVMQVSVVDENKMVGWSEQYSTPYKAYHDSLWTLSAGVEVGSFQKAEMPGAMGGRIEIGQRLAGIGNAGLAVSAFQEAPGVPQIISAGTYFGLSHNQLFNKYWEAAQLLYQVELGITDFNGAQLFHETIGVKAILGKHFSVALGAKMHQFVSTPTDSTPIENPEGKPVLKNNEVLPTMISLGLGVELL